MKTVHLGFEVGSGNAIEIPLAHTFVCGQTQQSGKTTTLRAIVDRSGARALAFVTKRGEDFDGRPIRPYLPKDGEAPLHWRQVENILASALEQRNLKFERMQIINAAKGARSLDDVQRNVSRLADRIKGDTKAKEVYTLLYEYLELVLPQMRSLNASHTLDLQPGLNVMDLAGLASQTQAMVIRAALERINHHETGVLTVLPEAWEFAPRGRSAPAKDEAIAMARKGAAPKVRNFLLVDSQDIAGVEPVVRQACSVWLLGVQRELNEVKRAIAMMKQAGIAAPKPADVAQLELGQFYACFGTHAIKVYVQPAWLASSTAQEIATGKTRVSSLGLAEPVLKTMKGAFDVMHSVINTLEEESVNVAEANALKEENQQLRAENADLRRRLEALEGRAGVRAERPDPARQHHPQSRARGADATPGTVADQGQPAGRDTRVFTAEESLDNEALYQAIKARLIEELPGDARVMHIITSKPELRVEVRRRYIEADGDSLRGRIARLIAGDFWSKARTSAEVLAELQKSGISPSNIELGNELKALMQMGFLSRDNKWYAVVDGMKVNIIETD